MGITMDQTHNYGGYFRRHYRAKFSQTDIDLYKKWFYTQWKFIIQKVVFQKNYAILEIGSGLGGVYSILKDNEIYNYKGIDLDEDVVQFCRTHFKVDRFENKNLALMPYTKKYDMILAFEVLEHLENPSEAIRKIGSLLKKGGRFVGTSPYPYKKNILADKTHVSVLHPENWKKLFYDNGFKSVEIFPCSFLPFVWRIHKKANLRIPIYLPFKYFISTTLIIARK